MSETMKPCPFCKGPAKLLATFPHDDGPKEPFRVVCAGLYETPVRRCEAQFPQDEATAIAVWNNRPLEGDLS